MSALISALLPVHDESPAFLEKSVSSILSQTFAECELLILDDGSKDEGTLDVLARLESRDKRIKLLRAPYMGLTETLVRGMAAARGEYIARQDSDDWSEPDRFERQVAALTGSDSPGLVGSQALLHREDGRPLWTTRMPETPEEVLAAFPSCNPFCHGSTMFKLTAARSVGGYRSAFACSQDYDLFWRLAERYGGMNLRRPLYHLRRTARSISALRGLEQEKATAMALILASMRKAGRPEDPAAASREVSTTFRTSSGGLRFADQLLLAGHFRRAIRAYLAEIGQAPLSARSYLKLARGALFSACPPLRERLFR